MDLIERQDAIDALAKQMPKSYTPDGSHPADEGIFQVQEVYADCIETLELLPSAQPERKIYSNMTAEDFEEWLRRNGICHPNIHEDISCSVVPLLIDDAINEVLSAQPERKTGYWIRVPGMNECCSVCNKYFPLSYFTGRPFDINYCPNCGAKMEGEG